MKLPTDRVAVKICGITCEADAVAAVSAGVDLLGFNTWKGTKRYIDLESNAEWISRIAVPRVALLVNAPWDDLVRVAALPFVDAIQLHGDEDAAYCQQAVALGKPVIKAIRAGSSEAFRNAGSFGTPEILLDAHVPGAFGGTGARIDLALAREFQMAFPGLRLWLAGGLRPDNVAEAVKIVRPSVVDVSSGVESEPGRKNPEFMRDFIASARSA